MKQKRWFRIIAWLLVCFLSEMPLASAGLWQGNVSGKKWSPSVDINLKAGNNRHLGRMDLFLPLLQNEHSLLFADIRGMTDSETSLEGNFGLAVRRLFNPDFIVGAYAFFDRRRSPNDNYFHQGTFGLEWMTVDWDARFNYYLPEDTTIGFGSANTQTFVLQGNNVTRLVRNSDNLSLERPLGGYDFEFGRKMWFLPEKYEGRAFLGYYYFNESNFPKIQSARFRYEQKVHDMVSLEFETSKDKIRRWNNFGGLRVKIPLHDTSRKQKLSPLEKRMLTKIERDIDVRASAVSNPTPNITEESKIALEQDSAGNVTSGNPQKFIVIGPASSVTDPSAESGTFENPCPTVACAQGVDNSAGANYIVKSGTALTEAWTLQNDQQIHGGGRALTLNFDGQTFDAIPAGAFPTITRSAGNILTIADNNHISGMTLDGSGTATTGISGTDTGGNTHIRNMNINNVINGINVTVAGTRGLEDLSINTGTAWGLRVVGTGAKTLSNVRNVAITGHTQGINLDDITHSGTLGGSNNVTVTGASTAVNLLNATVGSIDGVAKGGLITATGSTVGTIRGNTVNAGGVGSGSAITIDGGTVTTIGGTASGDANTISGALYGINVTNGATVTTIAGNSISNASAPDVSAGINVDATATSITNNTINATVDGIRTTNNAVSTSVAGNTITSTGDGIDIVSANLVLGDNNTITCAASCVRINNNLTYPHPISNQTIRGTGTGAVGIDLRPFASLSGNNISGNTLTGMNTGINLFQTNNAGNISNNTISGFDGVSNAGVGINLNFSSSAGHIENNTVTTGLNSAVYMRNNSTSSSIRNNNFNGQHSTIRIEFSNTNPTIIENNTINSVFRGIFTIAGNIPTIQNNNITAGSNEGMRFTANGVVGTVTGNTISAGSKGIEIVDYAATSVTGNTVTSSVSGVEVLGTSTVTNLNSNLLTGTGTGILVSGAGVTVTNLNSNTLTGYTTGIARPSGTITNPCTGNTLDGGAAACP